MSQSYDDHVLEALKTVKNGQHLRYINTFYKTKEVCLAAVKSQAKDTLELDSFYSVPMGNLDYVMERMKEIQKHNPMYLKELEKVYFERKEMEKESGYYGDFHNLQHLLEHYGATDYDDMQRKRFY
jgi:hypothetical protein